MGTRRHADTEAPLEGFEGRLQSAFEWVGEHPRQFLIALGSLLIAGAAIAVTYEVLRSQRDESTLALARIENRFAVAMGGAREIAVVSEPANPEQAEKSRVEALAELEGFLEEHGGRAAEFARLRAAEIEADLGRLDAAEARLRELAPELASDDPLRGVVLRLQGYVLEEQERFGEAGERYAEAAAIETYPDHAAVWLLAGDAYRRAGDRARASEAYTRALSADPIYAAEQRIEDRLALVGDGLSPPGEGEPPPVEPEAETAPGS